jgi:hypothetical protein
MKLFGGIIAGIIGTLVVTFLTSSFHADSDGENMIGFPFTFYTESYADRLNCTHGMVINYPKVILDVLIFGLFWFLLFYLFGSRRRSRM